MRLDRCRPSQGQIAEYGMAALVLASVAWVAYFFARNHYLPQPFLYVPADTLMDWFNPAYWANRSGAYEVWNAIYPPISFVFLRIFSIHSCYGEAINARDCDWIGRAAIVISYLTNCFVAFRIFRRIDPATAIPRGLAFGLGLPLLYCLERGNLILICMPAFMYAYSGLAKSRFWQGLAIAVTVNFKPYLVIASGALAFKRDWRAIEAAGLLTIAVYLLTLAFFGSGDPFQILYNMGVWVKATNGQFYDQAYSSTSYASLLLIQDSPLPILDYLPSAVLDRLMWLLPLLIHTTQLIALAGLVAAWLQPQAVTVSRTGALLVGTHMASQWIAGYGMVFLIFLVFLEQERRAGQMIALVCAYLLSLNYDVIIATIVFDEAISWLSGLAVRVNFGLAVGQFIRPGLVIIIVWALAYDTITQVILAHHRRRPSLGMLPA